MRKLNIEAARKALELTATMDGLVLEGNNRKVSALLSLHGHLADALDDLARLEDQHTADDLASEVCNGLAEALGVDGDYFDGDGSPYSLTVDAVKLVGCAIVDSGLRFDKDENVFVVNQVEYSLVPNEITLEMQRAYFDAIDANMYRVQTDCRFGRFDNNRQAYRAMLAAAPK